MSTNEKRFRIAAKAYADRKSHIGVRFAHKGKEILCLIPMRNDWTKTFHFDGKDTVSIKNRLCDPWGDMISLEAFEIAYGGEVTA